MAEADKTVDIFVGNIDAAREAHIAVHHKDLTVVTVVLYGRDRRPEAVEDKHTSACFFNGLDVTGRQGEL